MKDEEINVAIAEACGWTRVRGMTQAKDDLEPKCWLPKGKTDPWKAVHKCPDYCNDLNAMHKAEAMLLEGVNWEGYHNGLRDMIFPVWHANARQRAEAFLRTVGKWKEAE